MVTLILGTYPRTITGMFSGVWVLTTILIRLLMSIQVLLCPALCVGTCATHERFSQVESVATCGCCSDVCASTPLENGPAAPPCDPGSDSCNCFCGGAVVLHGEELNVVTLDRHFVILDDCFFAISKRINRLPASVDGLCQTKLHGRELLRAYCNLLI